MGTEGGIAATYTKQLNKCLEVKAESEELHLSSIALLMLMMV